MKQSDKGKSLEPTAQSIIFRTERDRPARSDRPESDTFRYPLIST
jgi:hypothetical protein